MTYILVIFIWAGLFAKGNDATMFSVPGFATEQECNAAGSKLRPLVASTQQDLRFVCLPQSKQTQGIFPPGSFQVGSAPVNNTARP